MHQLQIQQSKEHRMDPNRHSLRTKHAVTSLESLAFFSKE